MKKIILLTITLFSLTVSAQKINWMSFEEAIMAQKETPKKIFVDAYTVWCGPCKMLDKNTFQNKDVVKYVNENYYAVKFNAEGNETINFKGNTFTNPNFNPKSSGRNSPHELSNHFSIRAYPTLLFLDEDANFITPLPGYKTPKQLELYLKLFKTDDYKKITAQGDWENYQENFTYEFND
ncbi:thioredoxin fold domain-containing protein [uncultured Lutibacter sp.]|uniref:thioredoxin family protein n=1 Tax=uncultured Lutibacter sp. TaxID=437739 RepID=UPI00261D8F64|nr:thioredoxin fold domain-containing protein [uncultured Lutibacter sp.]